MNGRFQGRVAAAGMGLVLMACGQAQSAAPKLPASQAAPATVQALPAYEGQTVSAVEIAGRPGLDTAPLLERLPQKAAQPFSRALVDQSMGALKQALAGSNLQGVDLLVQPERAGVRVTFVLEPALYVGVYQFPGALQFPYTRLLEAALYVNQQPYSEHDIAAAAAGIEAFLQQEGYFLAKATPTLLPDAAHGLVNVRFEVAMGPRARFGAVHLQGATPAEAAHLQSVLDSWLARLRRSAVIAG
ncbi:MAG: hypothetical protein ACRD1E_02070, partial [Terriglobales bacterium]